MEFNLTTGRDVPGTYIKPDFSQLGDIFGGVKQGIQSARDIQSFAMSDDFSNKVLERLGSQTPTITVKEKDFLTGEMKDVIKPNPQYLNKLKELGLEAYALSLKTGDYSAVKYINDLVDDYNTKASGLTANAQLNQLNREKAGALIPTLDQAIDTYVMAVQGNKPQAEIDAARNNLSTLNGQYTAATGAPYAKAKTILDKTIDDLREDKEFDYTKSKDLTQNAEKFDAEITKSIDDIIKLRAKEIANVINMKRYQSMLANVDPNTPIGLATAVKAMSLTIEPGLAVTEGEGNFLQGSTTVSDFISTGKSIVDAVKSYIPNGKTPETADINSLQKAIDAAAKTNPTLVNQIKQAMRKMSPALQKILSDYVYAGTNAAIQSTAERMKSVYGTNLPESFKTDAEALQKYQTLFASKAGINADAKIIKPGGLPGVEEEEINVSNNSLQYAGLPKFEPDKSTLKAEKESTKAWVESAVAALKAETDLDIKSKQAEAIKNIVADARSRGLSNIGYTDDVKALIETTLGKPTTDVKSSPKPALKREKQPIKIEDEKQKFPLGSIENPHKLKSKADFDSYKKGDYFITPNGKLRQK